ncbi:hypothetical protein [Thioclava sp. GXIMD4215]|uniref:hypothetical protein n=1 Tax=Thioclava sp. GXIMD4215 TaxID=3131928 RepID=UPI003252A357
MSVSEIIRHISNSPGGPAGWAQFFGRDRVTGVTYFLPTKEEVSPTDLLAIQNRFIKRKIELSPAARRARAACDRTTMLND